MTSRRRNNAQHPLWQRHGRGPSGRRLCRRCLSEVPKGRSTFCGDACVEDFKIASGNSGWVRTAVYQRDRGVCASCGLDTDHYADVIGRLGRWFDRQPGPRRAWVREQLCLRLEVPATLDWDNNTAALVVRWLLVRRGWTLRQAREYRSLWEADHIMPVAEGGGGCGLTNYRTLCRPCHSVETRALHRRLKKRDDRAA